MHPMAAFTSVLLTFATPVSLDPPIADVGRFPSAEACREYLALNEEYRAGLRDRLSIYGYELHHPEAAWLDLCHREAYDLWYTWDCLRCAHNGSRQWLGVLGKRIGPEAYAVGVMPAPLPLWRFQQIE